MITFYALRSFGSCASHKLIDHLRKPHTVIRRNPLQPEPVIQREQMRQPIRLLEHCRATLVALFIVAHARLTSQNHDARCAHLQGFEDQTRLQAPGAIQADDAGRRRVFKPLLPRDFRRRIAAPFASKDKVTRASGQGDKVTIPLPGYSQRRANLGLNLLVGGRSNLRRFYRADGASARNYVSRASRAHRGANLG